MVNYHKVLTFIAESEAQELIQRFIQSEQFKNESKVINATLKLLEQQEPKLQHLRTLIDEGVSFGSAELLDEERFLQELKTL